VPLQHDLSEPYDALIGLGSNMGDKRTNVARAIDLLCRDGDIRLVRRSRDYRSAPWGVAGQDWFVNAVAAVATALSAPQLLARCLEVEDTMGRVRRQKWGPRLIDVDVLTYRGESIDRPELKVPHPYIEARSFVVVPLAEIAPGETIRGRRADALAAAIADRDLVALGRD
jgi:2-amino-4-hydroxy-6-hydroxymethyldihydropteridine diphosphokinase